MKERVKMSAKRKREPLARRKSTLDQIGKLVVSGKFVLNTLVSRDLNHCQRLTGLSDDLLAIKSILRLNIVC